MVVYRIPDLSRLRRRSGMYGLNHFFRGGGPRDKRAHGLIVSFLRLYDLALSGYEEGRRSLLKFSQPTTGFRFGLFILASGHFEVCVDTLRRAINHLKTLRAAQFVPQSLKELLPGRTSLLSGRVEGQISNLRHAIQHLEERIAKGEIGQDEPFVLYPAEDGIELGARNIAYEELANWISELAGIVETLARYSEQETSKHTGEARAD